MHRNKSVTGLLAALAAFGFMGTAILAAQTAGSGLGIFESQTDVGSVVPPGVASFDSASGVYTIRSAGANLWVNVDAFHFVWKKVSGDVALTADVKLVRTYEYRTGLTLVRAGGITYCKLGVPRVESQTRASE